MNLKQKRAELMAKAQQTIDGAKAAGVELTTEEAAAIEGLIAEIKTIDDKLAEQLKGDQLLSALGVITGGEPGGSVDPSTGEPKSGRKGYLDVSAKSFAGLADRAARGMLFDNTFGQKALLPAGQTVVSVQVRPEIATSAKPMSELLALLPAVTQSSPVFRYLRQTDRTNNAAVVAPGALKPVSTYGLTPIEGQLQVIAHVSEGIDKYALSDVGNLQQFIAEELVFGLHRALEQQVLNGTGTGQLTGLLNTVGAQTQAFAVDLLTTTRQAVTKAENAGYTPGAFVLSPLDWEKLELARTDTAGSLELGGPVDRAARKLWGVPIAICNALPAKTAVLLDPSAVAVDTDARVDVQWSEAVGDDFQRNLLRARCESRYHLSVYQPLGVVKIATAV
jgi:HK97 family phage major capsid protein